MPKSILSILLLVIICCSCEKSLQKSELLYTEKHDTSYLVYAEVPNEVFGEDGLVTFESFFDSLTWLCFQSELMLDVDAAEVFLTKHQLNFEKKKNTITNYMEITLLMSQQKEKRKVKLCYQYNASTGLYFSEQHQVVSIPDEERNRMINEFSQWVSQKVNSPYQKFKKRNQLEQVYSLGYSWNVHEKGNTSKVIFTTWGQNNSIFIQRHHHPEVSFVQNVE